MDTLKIVRLGHPVLRSKAKLVSKRELKNKTFQNFLDDLVTICNKHDGVGIAAPQVNVLKRVIVVHVDPKNPRYENKKPFPLTIVINPKIVTKSNERKEDWEGDLSADLRGMVPRSVACTVTGLDREGKEVLFALTNDFHARVFQHEIDHLNGIMFIDRVRDTKTLTEYEEWKKYWKKKRLKTIWPGTGASL
ncbi:MAG TPA: peptide deformylase [Patescibacteria group bacterium]|nr:peptide deformylase [Patescibacteria group bacterium]